MAGQSEPDKKKAKAINNAYSLLRERPRSEKEIRDRLRFKGYDDEIVADIVAKLKGRGEVDDARFAKLWVESRMHSNPMGDTVLKQELRHKGVSESIITQALEEKHATYDDYEVALNMARDKYERLEKLDKRKATKRLYDFLLRRGFEFDVVRRVIEEIVK